MTVFLLTVMGLFDNLYFFMFMFFSNLFMPETSALGILKVLVNFSFLLFLEYFGVFPIFDDFENCFKVIIAIFKTAFCYFPCCFHNVCVVVIKKFRQVPFHH